MTTAGGALFSAITLSNIVKATALLSVALALHALLYGRASAAVRHLVLTLGIVGVVVLPLLHMVVPAWSVVTIHIAAPIADRVNQRPAGMSPSVFPAADAREFAVVDIAPPNATPSTSAKGGTIDLSWWTVISRVYLAGLIGILIHLVLQRCWIARFLRDTTEVRDDRWRHLLGQCMAGMGIRRPVRLLLSRACTVPVTAGTLRPSIVIPAIAETWAADRRRAVILHELAHVVRFDCLTQLLASGACAIYWFHPVVWWVRGRLRTERELACDDRVLTGGTDACEYVDHLLEIAYASGGDRAPAVLVSMGRPHQLEGRLLAALDRTRNRNVPTIRVRCAASMAVLAMIWPLAAATASVAGRAPLEDLRTREALQHQRSFEPDLNAARPSASAAEAVGIPRNRRRGSWDSRIPNAEGLVEIRVVEGNSVLWSSKPIGHLVGLTPALLAGTHVPIQFRFACDAGTFMFDGTVNRRRGSGTVSFIPEPAFPAQMKNRGFAAPTPGEQYRMAWYDVSVTFLDEVNLQGYTPTTIAELIRARQHGVGVAYLRDLRGLGYSRLSLDAFVRILDHGVTVEFIRAMAAVGYGSLPTESLVRLRDHGVTPEYTQALTDLGYGAVAIDDLIATRDAGLTAEQIRIANIRAGMLQPLERLRALAGAGRLSKSR